MALEPQTSRAPRGVASWQKRTDERRRRRFIRLVFLLFSISPSLFLPYILFHFIPVLSLANFSFCPFPLLFYPSSLRMRVINNRDISFVSSNFMITHEECHEVKRIKVLQMGLCIIFWVKVVVGKRNREPWAQVGT